MNLGRQRTGSFLIKYHLVPTMTQPHRMLEEDDLTLAKAVNLYHSMKATKIQLRIMTAHSETNTVTVYQLHNKYRINLLQFVHRVLRIAQTVALSTSQGNVQHTAKHVASAENEIIFPLYTEALLPLDLMQVKSI